MTYCTIRCTAVRFYRTNDLMFYIWYVLLFLNCLNIWEFYSKLNDLHDLTLIFDFTWFNVTLYLTQFMMLRSTSTTLLFKFILFRSFSFKVWLGYVVRISTYHTHTYDTRNFLLSCFLRLRKVNKIEKVNKNI